MSVQHLLDSSAGAVRRLLKAMSNDNQTVDQRGWLEAMEVLRRSLTVPRSQQHDPRWVLLGEGQTLGVAGRLSLNHAIPSKLV